MAGALGIRLGGPRSYDGAQVDLPWLGNGRIDFRCPPRYSPRP